MTNKTSNPTIWQALPLSLTAPRFTSMASGRGKKKSLLWLISMSHFQIFAQQLGMETQHSARHFPKIVYLTIFYL